MIIPTPKLPIVRSEVREVAEYRHEQILKASIEGRNSSQVSLDLMDLLEKQMEGWAKEDVDRYCDVLSEEIDAISRHMHSQSLKRNEEAKKLSAEAEAARNQALMDLGQATDKMQENGVFIQWLLAAIGSVFLLIAIFKIL